jgi:small-conductance mechanosensitive channel
MAWLVRRAVELTERAVFVRKELRAPGNFAGRALVTRVSVLRKVATVVIGAFALSATLMLFDEVRDVGRSVLASAGIAGVILGFAAQRTLGNLFAGLQIALTQPIRLGDQIGVEGDVGVVEEITLTYVVVRLWDQRRKIVPISFLIENSVVNYTRTSSAQTGAVLLRADFTLPVPEFRAHMETLVRASRFWDKKTFAVQVVDAHHESMELRIIGGAATPGDAFNLQCELREAALDFIHLRYPQCLPKAREEGKPIKGWKESEEFGPRDHSPAQTQAAPAAT